jgi:hypothetical protein
MTHQFGRWLAGHSVALPHLHTIDGVVAGWLISAALAGGSSAQRRPYRRQAYACFMAQFVQTFGLNKPSQYMLIQGMPSVAHITYIGRQWRRR